MSNPLRKFRLPLHRRYERYCSLAATGQLGGPEMFELNEHIASCRSCGEFLESVTQVSVQAMPLLAENRSPLADMEPPSGIRARFLSRLAAEQVNPGADTIPRAATVLHRPFALLPTERAGAGDTREALGLSADLSLRQHRSVFSVLRLAAVLIACALVGLTGFYYGKRTVRPAAMQAAQIIPSSVPLVQRTDTHDDSGRMNELQRQKAALEGQLKELNQKLSSSQGEQQLLRDQLGAANEKLASLNQQIVTAQSQRATDQDAKNQVAILQSEVDRLNQRIAQSEVKVAIEKQTTEELTVKLETAESDIRRERELKSAKSEMGDVVAARNLHIVDVYDADTSGRKQRAYGRVFYVEGKSLLFYAYDLNDPRQFKKNVVFYVWGGKAGVKEVTHSLGILHKDDDGQSRWAMTFDDPKVLSQINSVFVTAESGNKQLDAPHGKKVLYAYFGGPPNHP
jgi:uncharacterized coiled-coil protein SlyX